MTPADPAWTAVSAVTSTPIADVGVLLAGQVGYVLMYADGGGWRLGALHHPKLTSAELADFQAWGRERLYAAIRQGPAAAGFRRRTVDDGWQLYLAIRSDVELHDRGLLGAADSEVSDVVPPEWTQ